MEEDPALLVMAITVRLARRARQHCDRSGQAWAKNKTCRLFGAARGIILRASRELSTRRRNPKPGGEAWLQGLNNGKCGRATRTLARESPPIVASGLSGTTSRAAVLILNGPVFGVNARARKTAPGEG